VAETRGRKVERGGGLTPDKSFRNACTSDRNGKFPEQYVFRNPRKTDIRAEWVITANAKIACEPLWKDTAISPVLHLITAKPASTINIRGTKFREKAARP
jgi:hypothetical protein